MRILGMEFGAWSLKAVEMESRFGRMDILDLHEVKIPLQTQDFTSAYKSAVETLMAKLPSHPEKIVTSLPPIHTALRFLQLPIKKRKKVEHSFRFELEDNVPLKLEDCIVEHHVTITKEGSLVFAAIAPKKHIQSHVDWLNGVGIDPDWLTFEGMGIINAFLSAQSAKKAQDKITGPVLLLDIGHAKTNLSIIHEGQLKFFRSLGWGGLSITQAISTSLVLSLEAAEEKKIQDLKLNEDSPETEELRSAAVGAFASFLPDISHCQVTFRSLFHQEVTSVLVTGGTAKTPGIDVFIQKQLDKPVSFFKPFQELNLGREIELSEEMRFGEPLGRAHVFSRKSALLFNFRQQEVAKSTSLTAISTFLKNPNVVLLLRYAAILAVILFLHVTVSKYFADKEARTANEELKKVFGETFRNVPTKLKTSLTSDPAELKKFIDQKNNEVEQKLRMLSKARTPVISIIKSLSDSFPSNIKVDVNSISLDDRSFTLEGVLYEGTLDSVTTNLKKINVFNNVTLAQDGQRFTYKGEVVAR